MMTLYKGRISGDASKLMDEINRSLPIDIRLLPYDVATNKAWAFELARLGYLSQDELTEIRQVLDEIRSMYDAGDFDPLPEDEDIHTLIERLLTESLGDTGAKIHTGRSRNDQVACDFRLYILDSLDKLIGNTKTLVCNLRDLISDHTETLLAGTTHMQPAQPISLGHFLSSLAFMLIRDAGRFEDCRKRSSQCPLGAGAIAGSGFPVDRALLAKSLGFSSVAPNSLDAISDRDAAQETANACAITAAHLSRFAEQFIIWCNPAFGYMRFSDEWSTGSSMMPQKRNPDAMELVRGKSARIISGANSLLMLTKGLPLSYAKDLQEDKQALFDVIDNTILILRVFAEALASATFFPKRMKAALSGDLLATDLADKLAEAGVPFRKAHERVGALVSELEREETDLLSLNRETLDRLFPELEELGFEPSFKAALEHRAVEGGCAPKRVRQQLEAINTFIGAAGSSSPETD